MTMEETKSEDNNKEDDPKKLAVVSGVPDESTNNDKKSNEEFAEETESESYNTQLSGSVYSMIVVGEVGNAFFFALCVAAVQIMLFLLFIQDLRKSPIVPENEKRLSAMQFFTIFLAVSQNTDLIEGITVLTNKNIVKKHPARVLVANLLRIAMGIFSLIISFLLIRTQRSILDLVQGFAGAGFIAGLDELLFELAKSGFLTKHLRKNAAKVESERFQDPLKKWLRLRWYLLVLSGMLVVAAWAVFVHRQKTGYYLTSSMIVQFDYDDVKHEFVFHSGVYTRQDVTKNDRFVYAEKEAKSDNRVGVFGFCLPNRWTFSITDRANIADKDPCAGYLLKSSPTKTYAIEEVPPTGWSTSKGKVVSLQQFQSTQCKLGNDCSGNGKCNKEKCDCNEGFTGPTCHDMACDTIQTYYGKTFSTNSDSFSQITRDALTVRFKSRAVYFARECFEEDYPQCSLMFYLGARWALSKYIDAPLFSDYSAEDIKKLIENTPIMYVSDASSGNSPVGLKWNYVLSSSPEGFNQLQAIPTVLVCQGCNETIGVECQNNGTCVDGECYCFVEPNQRYPKYVGNHCAIFFFFGRITTTYYDNEDYCYSCPTYFLNANSYSSASAYTSTVFLHNGKMADELFLYFDQVDKDEIENVRPDYAQANILAAIITHNKYSNESGYPVLVDSSSDCTSLENITKGECEWDIYEENVIFGYPLDKDGDFSASVSGTLYFNNTGGEVMYEAFDTNCMYTNKLTSFQCDTSYKEKLTYARATVAYEFTYVPDTK